MKEEPKKTESDMIDLADMIDLLEAGDADTEKRRSGKGSSTNPRSGNGKKRRPDPPSGSAQKTGSGQKSGNRSGAHKSREASNISKSTPRANTASSGRKKPRPQDKELSDAQIQKQASKIPPLYIHIAFLVFIALIAIVGTFKLIKWNAGGESQYDPTENTSEFDTEAEDFSVPLSSSMAALQKDDGVTTILLLGNGSLAKTKGQEDSIGMRREALTGGKVYDASLDHTYLSVKNATYDDSYPTDVFSLYWISYCISTEDYTLLKDTAQTWEEDSSVKETVQMLENLDMSSVDVITIMYDSQDYEDERILAGPYDEAMAATCCGCLLQSVRLLQQAYPHIRIIVSSPFFNYAEDENQELQPGSTLNLGQGTLADYMVAYKNIAVTCGVSFIDNYFGTITESNYETYLEEDKKTLNSEGRNAIATRIADFIGITPQEDTDN